MTKTMDINVLIKAHEIEPVERVKVPIKIEAALDDGEEEVRDVRLSGGSLTEPDEYHSLTFLYHAGVLKMDVMLGVHKNGTEPVILYGQWNDGVVS